MTLKKINKEALKKCIEPHFFDNLSKEEYVVKSIKANKLLTHTRLDIAFKLLYLEMLEFNVKFSKDIY